MRIAIIGAGGVGGYFGARLAQTGCDVTFLARGTHLQAMLEKGLRVKSPNGDVSISPVKAMADASTIGQVDVVLVAVKAWQLEDSLPAIRHLLHDTTAVIPLLNGIDAPAVIAQELGPTHALGGLCGIVAYISAPGCIEHAGVEPFVRFGELDNYVSSRVVVFRDALSEAGVKVEIPVDIKQAMWQKFLFIAPVSGVGSVSRASHGEMRGIREVRSLIEASMREALNVGQAMGVALDEAHLATAIKMMEAAPAEATTSMQRDIAAGRPSELEQQTGAIVRYGRDFKVATPVNDVLYAALLPQEKRARSKVK